MKKCNTCNIEKEISDFHKNQYKCKECFKEYYKNIKEHASEVQKNYDRKKVQKNYIKKNLIKLKEKQRIKRKEISNTYVRDLMKREGFTKDLINNEEMIEIKKLLIKIKRIKKYEY